MMHGRVISSFEMILLPSMYIRPTVNGQDKSMFIGIADFIMRLNGVQCTVHIRGELKELHIVEASFTNKDCSVETR